MMTSPRNDGVIWKWKVRDTNEAAHLFVLTGRSPEEEQSCLSLLRDSGFSGPFRNFPLQCDLTCGSSWEVFHHPPLPLGQTERISTKVVFWSAAVFSEATLLSRERLVSDLANDRGFVKMSGCSRKQD